MMDQWVWLGGATLVLAAAFVGALALTGGEADAQPLAYDVSWPVEQGPATTRSDELREGQSETYTFELERANVTNVTVVLEWEDDVGEPDTFHMEVTAPNGTTVANASANETIRFPFDVADPPELETVEATNRSLARERLADESTDEGQGTWQVEVTLEEAPGRRPIPGAQLETEPDGGNGYQLTFAHDAFHGELGDPRPPASNG